MHVVYICTAGSADQTKASLPWHLAVNGSIEEGHDVSMVLAGDATELVVGGAAETWEGMGLPPMSEMVAKAREHEVPVFV